MRHEGAPPQTRLDFNEPSGPGPDPGLGVRLEVDEEGVGWILFDQPGRPVNTLTTPVMERLRALLDEAVRRNVKGLVFASDKDDMFVAGAEVEEIAGIADPATGMQKSAYGQAILETVSRFAPPTAALITGPCLGGGFELALACTVRLAENRDSVRIGLPEVKLGIIPGFGGTQRLPRRIGLRGALDLILAGKSVPARSAFRRGMVDALVPPGLGRQVAREVILGRRRLEPARPSRVDRVIAAVPWLRNFVLSRARKVLAAKVRPDHYPAPFLALDAVAAGFGRDTTAAFRREAEIEGQALATPAKDSLVWLFRASNRAKEPDGLPLDRARPVRRLAVVGAGVMGGGIAWLAAEKGLPIRVKDVQAGALEHALATAAGNWARAVRRRRLSPRDRSRRVEQLSFTLDTTGFRHVDLVFEAVIENLDVKRKVLAELEGVVREDAVLASNTSSLSITDIARDAGHPERVVGLHFFNPVHRMPLVEVVAGARSAPEAVATAYRTALDLGKTPILVQDGPGFLVNRLLAFYLGEALHLFEKGADPERTDGILTDFGMPMGPFELLDQIGLDVAEKVTHVMAAAFGDRLPSQAVLARLAGEGHLGRKSGRGFYAYERDRRQAATLEADRARGAPARWDPPREDVLDRLLLPMVNEAARCLEEGVVHRPLDVDLGMVMGTGFPPFRGGLLRYADARGVGAIVERLERLADGTGRFRPSEALRSRSGGFYRP